MERYKFGGCERLFSETPYSTSCKTIEHLLNTSSVSKVLKIYNLVQIPWLDKLYNSTLFCVWTLQRETCYTQGLAILIPETGLYVFIGRALCEKEDPCYTRTGKMKILLT